MRVPDLLFVVVFVAVSVAFLERRLADKDEAQSSRIAEVEQRLAQIETMGAQVQEDLRPIESKVKNHEDVLDHLRKDAAAVKALVARALRGQS